jgi:phosphatidylglycerol:prolipoprotein diacylglycerol transferase
MGMLLSVPMLIVGAILIMRAWRKPHVHEATPSAQAQS